MTSNQEVAPGASVISWIWAYDTVAMTYTYQQVSLAVLSSYYWRKKILCKFPCFPDKEGNASENKFILEDLLSHLWKIKTSQNFAYNYEPFKISKSFKT